VFHDAPEPVLALQRDLEGFPSVLGCFNLSPEPVTFSWAAAASATVLEGHGLPGSISGEEITLPAYGAWFGTVG
jgi:alpha-glucosidase